MRVRSFAAILLGAVTAVAVAYPLGFSALAPAAELPSSALLPRKAPTPAAARVRVVPVAQAAPAPSPTPVQQVTPPPVVRTAYRVVGVGDIMMGSDWPEPGWTRASGRVRTRSM